MIDELKERRDQRRIDRFIATVPPALSLCDLDAAMEAMLDCPVEPLARGFVNAGRGEFLGRFIAYLTKVNHEIKRLTELESQ